MTSATLACRLETMPIVGVLVALLAAVVVTSSPPAAAVPLNMPPPVVCGCMPRGTPLRIEMGQSGALSLNGSAVSRTELLRELARVGEIPPIHQTGVELRAHPNTPYHHIVQMIGDLDAAGIVGPAGLVPPDL